MIRSFGPGAGLGITNQPLGLDVGLPSGGGSNIKSTQRGSSSLLNGATSIADIPITSVDLTKSIVIISSIMAAAVTKNAELYVKGTLTTSTNLHLERNTGNGNITVTWVVVEFNNVKSLQTGSTSLSVGSETATVTAVDTSKSLLFASWTTTDAANTFSGLTNCDLTNSTTITFTQGGFLVKTVQWYLIEFN